MRNELDINTYTTPTNLVSDLKKEFEKLQINHQEIKTILNELTDLSYALDQSMIIAITDKHGKIISANDTFCEISKYKREELIGQNHSLLKSGYHSDEFFKDMWKTLCSGNVWQGEVKNKAKDGSCYWVKTVIFPILDEEGKPYKFISVRTDITEGKRYEQQVRKLLENDFAQVMRSLDNFAFKLRRYPDNDFVFTLIAGRLADQLGLFEQDHLHKSITEIIPEDTFKRLITPIENTFKGTKNKFEITFNNKHLFVTLSPFYRDGTVDEIVGSVSDLTELKNSEFQVEHMAFHDSLTDLPNRRKLDRDLTELLLENKENKNVGVFSVDFDHFKHINDTLGHSVGDYILITAAERLQKFSFQNLIGKYSLYHLGGDEFVFVFYDFVESQIKQACENLLKYFESPFLYKEYDIHLKISIGVSISPSGGDTPEELVKTADIALFQAKENGRNTFLFYSSKMKETLLKKIQIENDLRRALAYGGQFQLYYQPQVDLKTNKIVGVEALIRWVHPKKGFISPGDFIQVAEDTGLIIPIGEWVLKEACAQLKKWQKQGFHPLKMSVNIATKHFQRVSFTTDVANILKKAELEPEFLELEITENSLLDNTEATINTLMKIDALKIGIAIDDFGTGYSSLSYLKNFPISTLKIDRTFVNELPDNKGDRAIVSSIINLAHNLGLRVIAEGVEEKAALTYLKQEKCDQMQGFYFSRPVPADEITKLLKDNFSNVNYWR